MYKRAKEKQRKVNIKNGKLKSTPHLPIKHVKAKPSIRKRGQSKFFVSLFSKFKN